MHTLSVFTRAGSAAAIINPLSYEYLHRSHNFNCRIIFICISKPDSDGESYQHYHDIDLCPEHCQDHKHHHKSYNHGMHYVLMNSEYGCMICYIIYAHRIELIPACT